MVGEDDGSSSLNGPNDPTSVVLVSTAPGALMNFEIPFGIFNELNRQEERILWEDFPSLTHPIRISGGIPSGHLFASRSASVECSTL